MRILIVDDHAEVARSLAALLRECGHAIRCASDAEEALALVVEELPDLVLSDIRMPGCDGPQLLRRLHERQPELPVALMTAFGEEHSALEMLRLGAVDYFRKPIDVREIVALIERLQPRGEDSSAVLPAMGAALADGLVVHSPAMATVVRRCDRVHGMPQVPVLIEGETGTGKELIARRVHHGGDPDAAGPFVALNCAAIAEGLFEAELFGYTAGAFTGARSGGQAGKLALAAGGTLFLDEVVDLPVDQQAKLLRVLENRRWFPVGGVREEQLQARVVCAANCDLLERVRSGRFREDLYYRLKVMRISLPTLREEPEAVRQLVPVLLAAIAERIPDAPRQLAPAAVDVLAAERWPGNIRQLTHCLEALCIEHAGEQALSAVAVRDFLAPASAAPASRPAPPRAADWQRPTAMELPEEGLDLDAWQRALIAAALQKNQGSPVRTARYLGISRKVLYTLRKRFDLMES